MNKLLLKNNFIIPYVIFCIILLCAIYIGTPSFCSEYTYANNNLSNLNKITLDNPNNELKIQIDDTPITFKTSPEIVNGTIMVPMNEFFESMGAYVIWFDSQKTVVAYQDNMHLKLLIDKNEVYQNGHRLNLTENFIFKDKDILLPVQIITDTFNMNPSWNPNNNILYLNNSSDNAGIKTFKTDIYKTTTIKDLDLSFAIPYHWVQMNEKFSYGFKNDFESYEFIISSYDKSQTSLEENNISDTEETFDKDIYFSLDSLYEDRINIIRENQYSLPNSNKVRKIIFDSWSDPTDPSNLKSFTLLKAPDINETPPIEAPTIDDRYIPINIDNGFYSDTNSQVPELSDVPPTDYITDDISAIIEDPETSGIPDINTGLQKTQRNILYILTADKKIYFILCSQGEKVDSSYAEEIFDNIISTFIVRNESIDTDEEHYVEFESFYKYGFNLSQQYHSNMIIENSKLKFTGSINFDNNIQQLKVEVCHNHEKINFIIPVINNSFDSNIYLPFGLGQHNLSIYGVRSDSEDVKLMQFSVINIDRNITRYIIPTSKIQSDNLQIKSIAQTITYKHSTNYKSSYAILHWITHNIVIAKNVDKQNEDSEQEYQVETAENTLSNYEIFENAKGSTEQINQLLVSMYRAINIPSRVVYGKNSRDHSYYWTELYLNGSWMAADPVMDINYLENDFLAPTNSKFLPINKYRKQFTDIKIQNY